MSEEHASYRARRVFTPTEMAALDQQLVASGVAPLALMDRAASACVRAIRARYARRPVKVLCGPGQNGGDGWAVAHMLRRLGWPVTLHAAVGPTRLSGAAREAAARYGTDPLALAALTLEPGDLIVDALFGAGLTRAVAGVIENTLTRVRKSGLPVVAIDLPSGVHGVTGEVLGTACPADVTVTFHARKPGHLLHPGARFCGELVVADIGLPRAQPTHWHNGLGLWRLPEPGAATHKYDRGAVLVVSGGAVMSGAARLAALTAARAGAGAVTIASPVSALETHAAHLDAVMVRAVHNNEALVELIGQKPASVVIGPGLGTNPVIKARVLDVLGTKRPAVVDADALTLFEDEPEALFAALHPACVLTPHEGEFARLFKGVEGDKCARARAATERAGCTVVLKGPDTVIASPGHATVISTHGTPWLATAGSGDALAGIIAAFLAQGLAPPLAASAGCFVHAECGRLSGPGLTADDLPWLTGDAYAGLLRRQHAMDRAAMDRAKPRA